MYDARELPNHPVTLSILRDLGGEPGKIEKSVIPVRGKNREIFPVRGKNREIGLTAA